MDIVTGIPDLLERVVQVAKLVRDAANVDKSVSFEFQHGKHVAHQLILMGDIIKRTNYFSMAEEQIEDALKMANEATTELLTKLEEIRNMTGMMFTETPAKPQEPPAPRDAASGKAIELEEASVHGPTSGGYGRWLCVPLGRKNWKIVVTTKGLVSRTLSRMNALKIGRAHV